MDKLFYKIGEVAKMLELEPHVLRYWESEFGLKLTKSKKNQRLFQKDDIEHIKRIKALVYDEKFTIKGAKRKIREDRKSAIKRGGQMPLIAGVASSARDKAFISELETRIRSLHAGFRASLESLEDRSTEEEVGRG